MSEETDIVEPEAQPPAPNKKDIGDWIVRVGLIFKGVDSLLEVIVGILFLFPQRVAYWFYMWGAHELYRDHEIMAGRLSLLGNSIETHADIRQSVYLLIHGLAKVILIYGVFKEKKWGYLGLIIVLSFFACVEIIRAISKAEIVVGVLALFDIALVIYMAKEYWERYSPAREP